MSIIYYLQLTTGRKLHLLVSTKTKYSCEQIHNTYQYMHAARSCPAQKLFVSNIFFSLTGGETFSMCFWSDMEGERLESFLNIIYQYTISYQNLNF